MRKMSSFTLAALLVGSSATLIPLGAQAQEVMARVLTSTAVMQQVAVPRQVCTNQQVIQPSQPSGAGAIMGAIAGGALGNAVGGGSGRDVATAIGLFGGAMLGNKVEGTRDEVRNVQQCSTQTTYENRVLHYDVIYEYEGKRYNIKMPNDPGQYVRLQLNPVGAMPAPAAPSTVPGTTIFTPISSAPTAPVSTVTYVQPAPVYVYPPVATVASPFYAYPAAHSVYRPYVPATIGLSLNYSNVRHSGGHRGGHSYGYGVGYGHSHWR